ncbi:Hsp20/alpha crystallin family protein [Natrialbaceae archaeon A-gly3]
MRPNPLGDLEEVLDRVSRQIEEGMSKGTGFPVPGEIDVDVAETDEEYIVRADLPGYDVENIDLMIVDDALELEATRVREEEVEVERYVRRERLGRSVSRRIRLPEPVDEEGISATYDAGVLTVRLPREREETRRIDIE